MGTGSALHIHRAERADRLVDALGASLATPLGDPLAAEIVAVPTRGVERWLSQRLATTLGATSERADGVCAGVDFPFPGRLIGGAVATATGVDRDTDPWLPERAVWPLLDVVGECLDADWLATLAAHLGDGSDDDGQRRTRRFAVVRHLADLFDRYAVHRPAMLRAWAADEDTDGAGQALPPDAAWQAELWRCLRARLDTPSPAERLDGACERLRDAPDLVDLPARVSLFGLTRLPGSYLDVLRALATARDVHLYLLHPSPALWEAVTTTTAGRRVRVPRRDDPTAALPANPLLATWGRDAREMQLTLTADDEGRDHHHALDEQPATLLARIQADVRGDAGPPGEPLPDDVDERTPLAAGDRSLQVHACHGRARQVEVLRAALLHAFADDPTLEPRDVIVMCPDIETFAPLIHATFGLASHDADDADQPPTDAATPDLRVRLADRSLRQTNPVLGAVAELLELATARLTASQVVDFASREPVRRRFRLDDDELARIEEWAAAAGVRWGLDAEHRAPYKLDGVAANTWRFGLDRILLGVAMSEEDLRLTGGVLPLDDVDSGDIDLAGRLAELIDRLHAAVAALTESKAITDWVDALRVAGDALTATGEAEAWQRTQLDRLLDDVVDAAAAEGEPSAEPLALAEVRTLLADRLRGRPTRANFRTGHLTMCTLVPMRSVPHRVVCLLGLDDEVFPRKTAPDGDDLLGREPYVGDRDPRSEDRQLLLDAVLAAGDQLIITYAGRDERTNAPRPPAVPVGELLDVVDATAHTDHPGGDARARRARDQVVAHHPLQPFDARNFTTGVLHPTTPWSFDVVARDGAAAGAGERRTPPAFLDAPLPPTPIEVIELDDLIRFVAHPVRAFLRQRLGISLFTEDPEPADALPVELDNLERWAVGDRIVDALLAGADAATVRAAEIARGTLPPGTLGAPIIDSVGPTAEAIATTAAGLVAEAAPASAQAHVDLGGGRALAGTVADVFGDCQRTVTYSRLAAKHRLAGWVRLLALTATDPARPWRVATVGRGPRGRVAVAALPALADDPAARAAAARERLATLVDLYQRGLCEPLPLYAKTSAAWADARHHGRSATAAARDEWTSGWRSGERWSREDEEPEHTLVLGGVVAFEQLLEAAPRDDEAGAGWHADTEEHRFGRYARRLWAALLAHEELEVR